MDENDHLLARAIAGEVDAAGRLLEQHMPEMRRWLAGQIGLTWQSKLDEEDVLQVTCLEAFLQIQKFSPQNSGSFAAWLRRIASNNLRDAIEGLSAAKRPNPAKKVRPTDEDSHVALFEYLGGTTSSPSKQAAREEARQALLTATRRLPEDYRTVVLRYDLDELPIGEVARQMGRSEGSVYMLRSRAHDRLREFLGSASGLIPDSA